MFTEKKVLFAISVYLIFAFFKVKRCENVKEVTSELNKTIAIALKNNSSLSCLEQTLQRINDTPGARYQLPATKYLIKKAVSSSIPIEFHVKCKCGIYTATTSSKESVNCKMCSEQLNMSKSNFFVYIPIKNQLQKIIEDNWETVIATTSKEPTQDEYSDIYDCNIYTNLKQKFTNVRILSMTVNTDGANVFKTNKNSLWAIQLCLNFLPPIVRYIPNSMIVVGLHYGTHKPSTADYFHPLLTELREIHQNGGFLMTNKETNVRFLPMITGCSCDLPAKASVQAFKGHTGNYACGFCMHPGISIQNPTNNKSFVRYVKGTNDYALRTHDDTLEIHSRLQNENCDEINGVKGVSCLIAAKGFNLVNGFGIDYMHCILEGVMKKLIDLWLNSKHHNKPFYIGKKHQKTLNKRIKSIRPTSEITKTPRSLEERGTFAANEYRSLLLFYLRYALPGLLDMSYVKHFQLLSSATFTLLKEKISKTSLDDAEKNLSLFANQFEDLYGVENVTMNVHLLRHIGASVRNLGPLWAQSVFGFEGTNGLLVKMISGTNTVLHEIAWKYVMKFESKISHQVDKNIYLHGQQQMIINKNEEIAFNRIGIPYKDGDSIIICDKVKINEKKYTSKKTKKMRTVDFFVQTQNNDINEVKYYVQHQNTVYAVVELYSVLHHTDHLLEIYPQNKMQVICMKEIKRKLIYMEFGIKKVVTYIPNRFEKS